MSFFSRFSLLREGFSATNLVYLRFWHQTCFYLLGLHVGKGWISLPRWWTGQMWEEEEYFGSGGRMLRPSICCPPTLYIQDNALGLLHLLDNQKNSKHGDTAGGDVWARSDVVVLLTANIAKPPSSTCRVVSVDVGRYRCCSHCLKTSSRTPRQRHVDHPVDVLAKDHACLVFSGEVHGWFMRVCCWRDAAADGILHFVLTKIEIQWMEAAHSAV